MPRGCVGGCLCKHPPTWHVPRCPTARRKAGVQPEPYCLHKQLKHREPRLSFRKCWNSPQSRVPRCQPRANLASPSAFHKIAGTPAPLILFCTAHSYDPAVYCVFSKGEALPPENNFSHLYDWRPVSQVLFYPLWRTSNLRGTLLLKVIQQEWGKGRVRI